MALVGQHDFGVGVVLDHEIAAGHELGFESPFAPAAQWWARMTVLSTICTESLPPPSARAAARADVARVTAEAAAALAEQSSIGR